MGRYDDLLPEEVDEQNQPLIEDLRRTYASHSRDARSLARIRERLLAGDGWSKQPRPLSRDSTRQRERFDLMNEHEHDFRARKKSTWRRSLALIAAALVIALIVGSLVLTLNLAHHAPTATAPHKHPAATVNSIHMIDATTGWATCGNGCLLHTTDGGVHWQDATPPAILEQTVQVWDGDQFFLNATTAWISVTLNKPHESNFAPSNTSLVFHTTDGGRTWQEAKLQTNGYVLGGLSFLNAQSGWAVAIYMPLIHQVTGPEHNPPFSLYHTTNGGKTWTKILDAHAPQAAMFKDVLVDGISFSDPLHGIITGSLQSGGGVLYSTSDGGATWQQVQLWPEGSRAPSALEAPRFFSARDGLFTAVFSNDKGIPRAAIAVYSTHDGGATWNASPVLSIPASWANLKPGEHGMEVGFLGGAPLFIDMKHGWVICANANMEYREKILYTTSDGGQHWTKVIPAHDPAFQRSKSGGFVASYALPDFVSDKVGWVIGFAPDSKGVSPTSALYKTIDGGHTWTLVDAHYPAFITM